MTWAKLSATLATAVIVALLLVLAADLVGRGRVELAREMRAWRLMVVD